MRLIDDVRYVRMGVGHCEGGEREEARGREGATDTQQGTNPKQQLESRGKDGRHRGGSIRDACRLQ